MAVAYLKSRFASSAEDYETYVESAHSLIWATNADASEFEISLSIGTNAASAHPASQDKFIELDDSGIVLGPKSTITIETFEEVSIPYNLFGIIFPKGTLSHRYGITIPTTKVDPGFSGKLKILLVNNTNRAKQMKTGEPIGSLVLISTNKTVKKPVVESPAKISGRAVTWIDTAKTRIYAMRGVFYYAIIPLVSAIAGALIVSTLG